MVLYNLILGNRSVNIPAAPNTHAIEEPLSKQWIGKHTIGVAGNGVLHLVHAKWL
jgi:hypothetical protein